MTAPANLRTHQLPPKWDGCTVEWGEWQRDNSSLRFRDPPRAPSPAGYVMALAPGRRIPGRHCTWCAHTPHAGTCPVITDKQPCPCARRAT